MATSGGALAVAGGVIGLWATGTSLNLFSQIGIVMLVGLVVTVAGVGMHPWGKWGRSFVDYGVVAARAALAELDAETKA